MSFHTSCGKPIWLMYVANKTRTNDFHTRKNLSMRNNVKFILHTMYTHDIHYRNYKEAEDCMFVDVVEYMEDCTVNMT